MLLSARSEERPPRQPWRIAWTVLVVSLLSVMCSEKDPDVVGPGVAGSRSVEPPQGGAEAGGQGGSQTSAGGSGSGEGGGAGVGEPAPGGAASGGDAAGGAAPGGAPAGGEPSLAGAAAGGAPTEAEKSGLPCDVERLLRVNCQSCHGRTPVEGAVVSLLTRADLLAPSHVIPNISVGARSIQRITNSLSPMPPAPLPVMSAAELNAFRNWFKLDMPESTCEEESPFEDPYDAPEKCSSGSFWPTNYESPFWGMMPGRACLGCHRLYPSHAPIFSVAGTVYPTAHEPDRCYGVPVATGAKIIITDANGVEHPPLPVVSNGNFGVIIPGLALPYRAKIVVGDTERVMLTPQTNGDCNSCHSQAGTQGARGRIILP